MWFLYLDESGDLGFDFVNKKPSNHLTVCVLAINGLEANSAIKNAIRKTIKRKLHKKYDSVELKAAKTLLQIKEYFYEQVQGVKFGIYAVTLNKRRWFEHLARDKSRVYNYVARIVIEKIPFEKATTRVLITVDKSKGKREIEDFNQYILNAIKSRVNPKVPLDIQHSSSIENPGLQAVDLFCWGVFRVHESKDKEWYSKFRSKIEFETLYLPDK